MKEKVLMNNFKSQNYKIIQHWYYYTGSCWIKFYVFDIPTKDTWILKYELNQ